MRIAFFIDGFERKPIVIMSTARPSRGDTFRSGEIVSQSGLYRVEHLHASCDPLQVVLIARDRFPECPACGTDTQYTLVHAVPYIHEDADFRKD